MANLVAFVFGVIYILFCVGNNAQTKNINIVFIWFDDLSHGDTGYNGADYPTPILDDLANNDAIKINFHYTEPLCSASRTALLTGRYSWLAGMNNVVNSNTDKGFDPSETLFSEILDAAGWRTFIAGKWHIGYWDESLLPHNRGFRKGLYSHLGLQYYARDTQKTFAVLDQTYGAPSRRIIRRRNRQIGGPNTKVLYHDTYDISNYVETPVLQLDTSYNEDLYTQKIKTHISQNLLGDNPFFIYYSMFTPHSRRVQPPNTRPDGSTMDYTACYDAFPQRSIPTCDLDADTRCVFCKQMHYASQNIQEIIDEIKNDPDLKWDDTIVVITSDNGGQSTSRGGYSSGSSMPLRGEKAGIHEGGIRTPAILKGGYIENILKQNTALPNNQCEYNEMVHVSDWAHIFMSITGITQGTQGYSPDSDHSGLKIWENIKCKCSGTQTSNACDNTYPPRDELIQMRMCGDPNGDYTLGEKVFYSAAVRKGNWKLVVNGGNAVNNECTGFTPSTNGGDLFYYVAHDGSEYEIPNQNYYDDVYQARFGRIDPVLASTLYGSTCLDGLDGTTDINNPNYVRFRYESELLYNMDNDKIEACAVQNNPPKKQELLDILIARSVEYNVNQSPGYDLIESFKAQMDSYDCDVTYTKPWGNAVGGDIDQIWTDYIDKHISCP